MLSLITYFHNNYDEFHISEKDKQLLLNLDKEYGRCVKIYRTAWKCNFPTNTEKEYEKFINARKLGIKYFPQLKIEKNLDDIKEILIQFKNLLSQFRNIKCYLTQYYIERCRNYINRCKFILDPKNNINWYINDSNQTPSLENFYKALDTINKNPYKDISEDNRIHNANYALKYCKNKIEKLGFNGFVVKMKPNQIPRMSVRSEELALNISPDAKFSDIDLIGLFQHEIKGHCARRYYGAMTGLNLFIYGLRGANDLDEGIAIYNSLHNVKKQKPNILFNIALKTIIAYYLPQKDFCEIFDICEKLAPNLPTKKLFNTLIRFKREVEDCSILGGNGDDQSYFCGYQIIKNLPSDIRKKLTLFNIGPSHIKDINKFEKFFEINKFKPLLK